MKRLALVLAASVFTFKTIYRQAREATFNEPSPPMMNHLPADQRSALSQASTQPALEQRGDLRRTLPERESLESITPFVAGLWFAGVMVFLIRLSGAVMRVGARHDIGRWT